MLLSRLISERGAPLSLRSDNGPEFVSKALLKWEAQESLNLALIEPGNPWQNGLNESFNGKFRDECLSMEWFRCRAEARAVIEEWRRHYNSVRPHSSLNNMTPGDFCRQNGKNLNYPDDVGWFRKNRATTGLACKGDFARLRRFKFA